jgi:hypothetical protein
MDGRSETPRPEPAAGAEVRFAADKMLGRLARWLRAIGQDVTYGPHLSGPTLVRAARREGRVVLTRDTRLARHRDLPPNLFITSDRFREQLRQVIEAFHLEPPVRLFSRCLDCNRELVEAERSSVRPRVPPYVWATQERFFTCPRCHRVFWDATHLDQMRRELERIGVLRAAGHSGGAARRDVVR